MKEHVLKYESINLPTENIWCHTEYLVRHFTFQTRKIAIHSTRKSLRPLYINLNGFLFGFRWKNLKASKVTRFLFKDCDIMMSTK